mmetsp:Transcript_119993/g.373725  ORF Transcript_119993/g.373725 Transcript_119993/m.373725 type:complete len:331 (+) Transcript_119993:280-1272(+)
MIANAGPLDEGNTVRIIDFGLACFFHPKRLLTAKAGTPHFMAPEVIEGQYGSQCDLWSCGVSLYILLCGSPPFNGRGKHTVWQKVLKGNADFSHRHWRAVSEDARSFCRRLLELVPENRLTAQEALRDPWAEKHAPHSGRGALPATFVSDLQRFVHMNTFQRATMQRIAYELKGAEIQKLRDAFHALDKNGDGHLSASELHQGLSSCLDAGSLGQLVTSCAQGGDAIDYSEFIAAALAKRRTMREEACWSAFHTFDRDGSGAIEMQEIRQAVADEGIRQHVAAEEVERILREADADKSGAIDFREFVKMMHKACGEEDLPPGVHGDGAQG